MTSDMARASCSRNSLVLVGKAAASHPDAQFYNEVWGVVPRSSTWSLFLRHDFTNLLTPQNIFLFAYNWTLTGKGMKKTYLSPHLLEEKYLAKSMYILITAHILVASAISSVEMNSKSAFLPPTSDPFCLILPHIISWASTLILPASTRKSNSNNFIFHLLFHYSGDLNSTFQHNLTFLFLPYQALTILLYNHFSISFLLILSSVYFRSFSDHACTIILVSIWFPCFQYLLNLSNLP